jgi:transposase
VLDAYPIIGSQHLDLPGKSGEPSAKVRATRRNGIGEQHQRKLTDEFKREAVRLIVTSGRTVRQVAADLGIGKSTLTRWKARFDEAELLSGPHEDVSKELARLRRENETLRQERDLLKKATAFFARETSR